MVSRMILILVMFDSMGIFWIVEQPRGSMMQHWSRFEWFINTRNVYRHKIHMVNYGGESKKPTWLYSNMWWIQCIEQYQPASLTVRPKAEVLATTYLDRKGVKKCNGNQDTKGSQAYPIGFGYAVCELAEAFKHEMITASNAAEAQARDSKTKHAFSPSEAYTDPWVDADLVPVVALCEC